MNPGFSDVLCSNPVWKHTSHPCSSQGILFSPLSYASWLETYLWTHISPVEVNNHLSKMHPPRSCIGD